MGVEPIICGVIFPPWLFQKQVTWFLTLSRACLTFNLVYFLMLLSTPFKIAYPSVSRALILSLNLARRHINLEIYPFHSDAESYCWSRRFELHLVAQIQPHAYHYTKLRFLQEYLRAL